MRIQTEAITENLKRGRTTKLPLGTPIRILSFTPELLAQVAQTQSGYQPKFPLRGFQEEAIKHVEAGRSALVSAPTGSGKTVIAVAAMYRAIKQGKKLIYTAPIKALSNQKITEFREELARQFFNDPALQLSEEDALKKADQAVGLSTGDHNDKPEAPIQVMTTEVLNLLLHSNLQGKKTNKVLKGLSTIVFDEFHYLNDHDRGHVWEEAIINSPQDVQILGLSATMGNPEQIRDWINSIKKTKVALINEPEKNRPVQLKYFHINKQVTDLNKFSAEALSGKETLKILDKKSLETSAHELAELKQREKVLQKEKSSTEPEDQKELGKLREKIKQEEFSVQMLSLVKLLQDNEKLPAIVFKFSKKFCDVAAQKLADSQGEHFQLLSEDEKEQARLIIESAMAQSPYLLNEEEAINNLLKKGVAPHHAGHLPQFKDLVEKLFEKGLIKVVFATSTLAAGINMPARTTVLTELDSKGTGPLSISAFKQMAGRAGRPGYDTEGNVFVFEDPGKEQEIQRRIDATAENIMSHFKIKFVTLLSLIQAKDPDTLNKFIGSSLLRYQETHPLERTEKDEAEAMTSAQQITESIKSKDYLTHNGFIDDQGALTDKGQIATCFKFNNPLFITELLLELSKDRAVEKELGAILIDNFIALVSLLGSDEGQADLEKLNEKLEEYSDRGPEIVSAIATTMQDSLNGLAQEQISTEAPAVNYERFFTNLNWATAQKNIQAAKKYNRQHPDGAKLFKDIISPKQENDNDQNTVKAENPGTSLRSLKQTLNLLKHLQKAAGLRTKADPKQTILSPKLAELIKDSIRLINRDIVADNKFNLTI